jgi:hypothetical protein
VSARSSLVPTALVAVSALALPGVTLGASPAPSVGAPAVPRLVEMREVTVDGARLISMSPDGTMLAAVRPMVGYQRGQLCTVDLATLEDRACADLGDLDVGIRLEDVTWSPDSTRLAFTGNAFQTFVDGDLWVMDAATGELTTLDDDGFAGSIPFGEPEGPSVEVSLPANPVFSPDSSTIAFSRTSWTPGTRTNWISTVPADGGEVTDLRRIVDAPGFVYFGMATASDDGAIWFSFQSSERDDARNGVWVMPADGSTPRQIVGDYQDTMGPAILDVSSDGAWLLLQDPEAMGRFGGELPIYALADAAGETVTPLEPPAGAPLGSFVGWAGFSPDARWLLVLDRLSTDPRFGVRIRSVDGTVDEVLVDEGIEMAGPVDRGIPITWSTNGTAFLTGAGKLDTGYLLTIDGGTAG